MEDRHRLLHLVRKLLKLAAAGSGATEEEAALALQRAREILAKYNLSLVEPDQPRSAVGHLEVSLPRQGRRWRELLATAIARANLCDGLLGLDGRLWIVGRPDNAAAVTEMYRWVAGQLRQLARLQTLAARSRGQWYTGWEPSFLLGAAARIAQRLREQGPVEGTTALVKTEAAENLAYIKRTWGQTRVDRSTVGIGDGAKAAGWAAGADVPLAPPQRLEGTWNGTSGSSRYALASGN